MTCDVAAPSLDDSFDTALTLALRLVGASRGFVVLVRNGAPIFVADTEGRRGRRMRAEDEGSYQRVPIGASEGAIYVDTRGDVSGLALVAAQLAATMALERTNRELERDNTLAVGEAELLAMVARGADAKAVLTSLCRLVEELFQGPRVTVMRLGGDGWLRHVAAPSMPSAYTDAIDRSTLGPGAPCGAAAAFGKPVLARDIATDPIWAKYRDLALFHGIQSCWSSPIFAFDGSVLGTFAVYFADVAEPTAYHVQIVGRITHLASIVIERDRSEQTIRRNQFHLAEAQRLLNVGSFAWVPATGEIIWSEHCYAIFGFSLGSKPTIEAVGERVYPDDRELFFAQVRRGIERREDWDFQNRLLMPDGSVKYAHTVARAHLTDKGVFEVLGAVIDDTAAKLAEQDLRATQERLQRSEIHLNLAQRLSLTGSYSWDVATGELRWSDETYRIFGYAPTVKPELSHVLERTHPEDLPGYRAILERAAREGTSWEHERRLCLPDGSEKVVRVATEAQWSPAKTLVFTGAVRDVTAERREGAKLQASLREKEALLKEVHHRVKNNLQLISSLLNLQAARSPDLGVAEQFADSRNRVRSMALVHENLYLAGDLSRIPLRTHLESLCAHLARAYVTESQRVAVSVDISPTDLELDLDRAVACGLIVNELVSNALKHAFPGDRPGTVAVEVERRDARHVLSVRDDGIGLGRLDIRRVSSMGLQLVNDLADQLHGSIETRTGPGTCFEITFDAA